MTRLFAYLPAPFEAQDRILLETVAPLVRELEADSRTEAVSFTRSSTPVWLVRVMVRGSDAWLQGSVRPLLERRFGSFPGASIVDSNALPGFEKEIRRWGGEIGMSVAERAFHLDTVACFDWLAEEARGELMRTRREIHMIATEWTLDVLGFGMCERLAFYEMGRSWPVERGLWQQEVLEALEGTYQSLRSGLAALLGDDVRSDPAFLWGGSKAAEIAERYFERLRPVADAWIEARDAHSLDAEWPVLVWSLAHTNAIRLGVNAEPEAMLRYFMYRYHQDRSADQEGSHRSP
jgi:thiopeptide-type bacteriocin biosynthesis protein